MFMSFFLQLKRNEGFWGKHSRILVDFSGGQSVEGPSWSFSAASKDDPSWEIRVLSRETVGHFLRKIQIYIVFNHKCSSWTSLASHYVNTHVTHARTFYFLQNGRLFTWRPLITRLDTYGAALKLQFGPSNCWPPLKSIIWRKFLECFPQKSEERHKHLG